MNDTALAEPPTKIGMSFEGNSSIILLNKIQDLDWLTLSVLYIPNVDFSSSYKENDEQFYTEETEFYTVQIIAKQDDDKIIGFKATLKEGLISIVNVKNNYYTILVNDVLPSIIGATRDYFIPFIPVDEDSFEDLMFGNNQNQKDKVELLEKILNTVKNPFEQITNPKILPQEFQNYEIKGSHCKYF